MGVAHPTDLIAEIGHGGAPADAAGAEGEGLGGVGVDQVDEARVAPGIDTLAGWADFPFALVVVAELLSLGEALA
jgi:hypothetical protein